MKSMQMQAQKVVDISNKKLLVRHSGMHDLFPVTWSPFEFNILCAK